MAEYRGCELVRQMDSLGILPGSLAVWGLGQMGVAIKGSPGGLVYIDPVLSNVVAEKEPANADKFSRAFPAPLQPGEINNAALVLCTHEHIDHTDPYTLGPLAKASPEARFAAPRWASKALDEAGITQERRLYLDPMTAVKLGPVTITAIPAAHYEMEFSIDLGYRFFSYLIEWNGVRFFHSGDTLITPAYLDLLRRLPPFDIALVAMNGRDAFRESKGILGNLLPVEAAWLASEMGWDTLLGGHNDLFSWNSLQPGELANAVSRINPRQKYLSLQPGQLFYYVR